MYSDHEYNYCLQTISNISNLELRNWYTIGTGKKITKEIKNSHYFLDSWTQFNLVGFLNWYPIPIRLGKPLSTCNGSKLTELSIKRKFKALKLSCEFEMQSQFLGAMPSSRRRSWSYLLLSSLSSSTLKFKHYKVLLFKVYEQSQNSPLWNPKMPDKQPTAYWPSYMKNLDLPTRPKSLNQVI